MPRVCLQTLLRAKEWRYEMLVHSNVRRYELFRDSERIPV